MKLVERSTETEVLNGSLANCLAGKGGVILVSGPVGVGKTHLLRNFARQAVEAGAIYLSATASRVERCLPLGVLGQLFMGADLPADTAERVRRRLEDGALTAMMHEREDETTQQVTAPVLHGLTAALLELSERAPLLIGVDDVHFADVASLQCLLFLVRRAARARVLVVANEAVRARQPRPMFRSDLLSQPHSRQIRLSPLSPCGVTSVLAEHLSLPEARQLAADCHQASGGNPLLVNALIEDYRAAQPQPPALAAGDAFGQAVLTCLYRSDATLLRLARALAVLGGPAPPALIGELLGLDVSSTVRAVDTATEAGLLDAGQFRHPRACAAVLDAMGPEERAAMHEHTAYLLYKNGAPAMAVARHAIAAHHVAASWSAPVLREAAEHALQQDDMSLALDCLRLAEWASTDETERATIKAALVRAQWRVDPSAAERHVSDLLAAAESGRLKGRDAVGLVNCLLWYGRPEEAVELLDRVDDSPEASETDTAAALYSAGLHLAYIYPALADRARAGRNRPELPAFGATGSVSVQAAGVVDAMLTRGFTKDAIGDAERVLQRSRLDDAPSESIMLSLDALTLADRPDTAAFWCDPLLREAEERRAPTWSAILSSVRSLIAFRQGDLPEAERYARAALSHIPPRSLGVLIGLPLSTLLLAATRTGRYQEALTHLNMPVPDAMFQTPFGLHYLRARGHYYLTRDNYQAAIADFEVCRDLMVKWNLDIPGIVPWRIDLAEVYLRLGQTDQARQLVQDQLSRLGPYNTRTRGIALRVLAATAEARHRPAILRQAVEVLQGSCDQLELANALDELSKAQHALGEHDQARLTTRRATYIAAQVREGSAEGVTAERRIEDDRVVELSDAERRVATLAAQGHTNRQIARKLYVTVSTVEQHLTRVYRKLQVNRRSDLPMELLCDSA